MTQPETAVGSVTVPESTVAEPTLEDRFAAHAHAFDDEEEAAPQEVTEEADEAEADIEAGDDEALEADAAEEDAPAPIKAPSSWTAEEQADFAELPRAVQETVARREAEREKFVQSKSQEAARAKTEVETQAFAEVKNLAEAHATRLQSLLPQIPARPDPYLQVTDPMAWADQQATFDWAVAQHQAVQHEIDQANALAHNASQEQTRRSYDASIAILTEHFPEYLDPVAGAEHRKTLGSVASELGFTSAELANPDARDILALRRVAEMKTKADKYDKLMAGRMETVRNAKQLPKVSKPGQPAPREAASAKRLEADRTAMRNGDRDAATRVFGRYLA